MPYVIHPTESVSATIASDEPVTFTMDDKPQSRGERYCARGSTHISHVCAGKGGTTRSEMLLQRSRREPASLRGLPFSFCSFLEEHNFAVGLLITTQRRAVADHTSVPCIEYACNAGMSL
jgi:hypothetical protein